MTDSTEAQVSEVAAEATADTALTEAAANPEAEDKITENADAPATETEQKLSELYDEDKSDQSDTEDDKVEAKEEGEEKPDEAEVETGAVDFENLTMPEGFEFDQAAMDKAKPVLEELGVDKQEDVQKLVDLFAEIQGEQAAEAVSSLTARHEEWLGEIKSEWGSDYDDNLATAAKALNVLGGKELKDALNVTGAGNHPAIIKAFHLIGKAVSEDGFVAGGGFEARKDGLSHVYPSMTKG